MWDKHQIVEEPYDGKLSRTVLKPSRGSDAPAQVNYHRILKCHVIVELKIDKFRHEYASLLNMYLNYFKAEVMQSDDNPPIGILLCTEKGDTLVEYATAGLDPNIFVQKYMIELPTEEEIKEFISSSNY